MDSKIEITCTKKEKQLLMKLITQAFSSCGETDFCVNRTSCSECILCESNIKWNTIE